MSWLNKNYEKATLAGTVVVALGLAYLGWSKLAGVDETFSTPIPGDGGGDIAVKEADLIPKALQSMKLDRSWTKATDGDRPVDLFTGIALFIKSDEPEKAVDPLEDPPIHPPIENIWWLNNRIDPGYADSPSRDPDGDGFSNLEEYKGKTDPNNGKVIPNIIAKLMYIKDDSITWYLRPGFGDGGKFPFSYVDNKNNRLKTPAEAPAGPGDLFFDKAPLQNRFKMVGSELIKKLNEKINMEMEVTIVTVEDQRPNKKGKLYKIPAPLPEDRRNEHLQYDRTAVFSLEALGLNGKEFKVEENTAFALPPGAATKEYLVKEVTPNSVVVEYPDQGGTRKTVEITKGTTPTIPGLTE